MTISTSDYRAWAEFRYQIRLWLRLSEEAARDEGIPPQHHQALLAIKGYPGGGSPLIADLAERLQLRHHSVVGLVDRLEAAGLVERHETGIGRAVALVITPDGEATLERISERLRPELKEAADMLIESLGPLTRGRRARLEAKSATPARPNGSSNGSALRTAPRSSATRSRARGKAAPQRGE